MTTIYADSPTDSGAILDPAIVDTYVHEVQPTRDLTYTLRPPLFRRPDATGEQPLLTYPPIGSPTPGGPSAPPGPPQPPPPPVRGRHRRQWSPGARRALRCWIGLAVVELAILAPLVVTL